MMKKKYNFVLLAMAVALIMAAGAGSAIAYFTSYAVTDGTYPVAIGDETVITEEFSQWTKHVRISATDDSGPVYIRARAFHPDLYSVEYADPDGNWELRDDGFWYYKSILYAGQQTSELTVSIKDVPEGIKNPLDFGVAVIYESTPVRHDEAGNEYADWGQKLGKEAE